MSSTPQFLLVDEAGTVLVRRPTLGAVRNYARLSNAGKRAVAIVSPEGERLPVRKGGAVPFIMDEAVMVTPQPSREFLIAAMGMGPSRRTKADLVEDSFADDMMAAF